VTAKNSIIVGFSIGNPPDNIDVAYKNTRGLVTPRTDGFKGQNLSFYNFGATMTPFQACSQC